MDSIREGDSETGFDSGNPELNRFFATHALRNQRRGIGSTYVLRRQGDEAELPAVLGFYTVSMASVETKTLPRKHRSNVPAHPLPVALIGRLAVDVRARGRGCGQELLVDAFRRIEAAAESIACFGVIVDAKDAQAVGFYQHYGFELLPPERFPQRMFIAIETLRAAAASSPRR